MVHFQNENIPFEALITYLNCQINLQLNKNDVKSESKIFLIN